MITKCNIGLSISRNYNVVKLEVLDYPLEHNDLADFKVKIQGVYDALQSIIDERFNKTK